MSALTASPVSINFHGTSIPTYSVEGVIRVAMKTICQSIGLDWRGQRQRILRHPVLSKGVVMINTPSKGGIQKHLTLPLNKLNGWLFGVDASRVKPEIREKLVEYQEECFDVLSDYWQKGEATNPRLTTIDERRPLNRAVRTLANLRSAQGDAADYGGMWKLVNGYLGVATIEDATQEQVERAMAFVQDSIERESRRIIEGEWLSKNDTPDLTQDQGLAKCLHTWSRVATHRWKELDQLTAHQDRLIQQQEQMLEEQRDLSNKISAVRANLYDPLMEMSHQLSQLPSDSKADASDVRQAIEMQNRARRH